MWLQLSIGRICTAELKDYFSLFSTKHYSVLSGAGSAEKSIPKSFEWPQSWLYRKWKWYLCGLPGLPPTMDTYKDYLQRRCAASGFTIDSILQSAASTSPSFPSLPPLPGLSLPFHHFPSLPSFLPPPESHFRLPPLPPLERKSPHGPPQDRDEKQTDLSLPGDLIIVKTLAPTI